jgi:hypothetical protein
MIKSHSFTCAEKFKILNLIERLGGPAIATYCADLFPINMFEFYLFVANVVKNFFMVLDLFNPNSIHSNELRFDELIEIN